MALFVFTSASGSPGVTTTVLGIARAWPRPLVLVEADPTGGSGILAGFFRGEITPRGGLIDLALALRHGNLAEALPRATLELPDSTISLLTGPRSHDQARSLIPLWEPLTKALRELRATGQDVLVDAGRLGLAGWPAPLVFGADLTLLVTRNSLPALAGARSWSNTLSTTFDNAGGAHRYGLVVVDESKRWPPVRGGTGAVMGARRVRAYGDRQLSKTLGVPVVASIPWRPEGADAYSHGAPTPRGWQRSPLARAYASAGEAVRGRLESNQELLSSARTAASLGGDRR